MMIDKIINDNTMVLLEFYSKSCMPCTAINEKILVWLKDHPGIVYRSICVDDHPKSAADYGIYSVPTILFFVESKRTIEKAGYFSLEDILDQIERIEYIYKE